MVLPQTVYETDLTDPKYPRIRSAVFTGVVKFDEVYKPTSGSAKQFYANLPGVYIDLYNFLKILTRFEFTSDQIETYIDSKFRELAEKTMKL